MVNSLRGRSDAISIRVTCAGTETKRGDTLDLSPDTNEPRARRDLVPEGVSYLSSSEGQFSLVEL